MRIMYRCCAGLDVHKETVQCCVRRVEPDGSLQETVRQFGTMTDDLLEMVEALKAQGVTHVAMESTGVFWKPIYNLLEEHFSIVLVNPAHCKQVPGRKTDVKDCQWLAELLQYGLLRCSFIPPQWQRDLRDLTRERTQLINERTRVANRMHKILEDANIKLGSVATDILGASGRDMLRALIGGEQDPAVLAEMARSRLRDKIPQLRRALRGRVREHHRFQLELQWDHLEQLDQLVARLNEKITQLYQPYEQQLALVDEVPGMDRRMAETVMAEVGMDMRQFPSDSHLCSWAAVCSGNHESAGKRRSGRTRKGNRWLRQALAVAAQAAGHSKNSYLGARFRRLAARRGKKRATIAVAHTILRIIYHMLREGIHFHDLGPAYFDRLNPERIQHYLVSRLERLAFKVMLEPQQATA